MAALLDRLLALGLPLLLLAALTLWLSRSGGRLPLWLQRLERHQFWIWNLGIALILVVTVLRWQLSR